MRRLLTLAFLFAMPATAHAGSYHVYTCGTAPNNAWKTTDVAGVTEDVTCTGGSIGLNVPATARMADNTSSALTFTAPTGTTIADFALTRQLTYRNPIAAGTHRYFVLYSLGATHFAGAGNFADGTRNPLNTQKHWYGHPENNATLPRATVTRATFPALAKYAGNANQLIMRVGCYARGSVCSVDTGGAINHTLVATDITINDPTPPALTVEAGGLFAGGGRNGADPVTFTTSDNAGISKIELIDATATPVVVGAKSYACDHSRPAPCSSPGRDSLAATALPAGQRRVVVRATDAGGNITDAGPFNVTVFTPSDRGAVNGANATDTGTIDVRWAVGGKNRRTLAYGRRAGIRGRLVNSAGAPVAGARITLLTRNLRRDADLVPRTTLVTAADGSFITHVSATASRLLQFAWLSHANDVRPAANGYLVLEARATASLRASTARPRFGRTFTLSGRLRGVDRGNVPVILQARQGSSRRYETFADTTTSASGRFKVSYRFRNPRSRGRSFTFRARIRPAARFPYATGHSRTVTVRVR